MNRARDWIQIISKNDLFLQHLRVMYLFALSDQTRMRQAIPAAFAEYLWVIADANETSKNAFHLKKTGLEQAV